MKISQAIEQLKAAKKEVGDVEIINIVEDRFHMERDRSFEIIEIPKDDEPIRKKRGVVRLGGEMVVAFMQKNILEGGE